MKMRRALGCAVVAAALTLSACGAGGGEPTGSASDDGAPAPVKIGAVTIVSHPSLDLIYEGVKEGLADAGYKEGENLTIGLQNPQGDQATLTSIANTYASSDEDLFVAIATPPAQAMAQVETKRPIVFASVTDPVAAGLVQTMDAPGGNVTGTSDQLPPAQQLRLIRDILPDVRRVGIVYSASEVNAQVQADEVVEAGKEMGIGVDVATVINSSEVQQAAESLDVDAYLVLNDNTVVSAIESMVQVAEANGRLLVTSDADSVKRGAAAALAADYRAQGRQTAAMIVRILQGDDPADMPVERQESLEISVNPEAADRMGVTIPAGVVKRAAETY